jgi:hypothetical protein
MFDMFMPWVIAWAALAILVGILALYRRQIAESEDDTLHVNDATAAQLADQAALAKRLDKVDVWGKSLTVLLVLYGLAIAIGYIYMGWTSSQTYNP